jgi:hypothetical protein
VNIPFNVEAAFGSKGQVRVRGTINGHSFRGSAMPHGDGTHFIVVNKDIRDAIGVTQGDTVQVIVERDTEERRVDVPDDLRIALDAHEPARTAFEKFSYSHQKEYVDWIESAKTDPTRKRRIQSAMEKIAQRERLKK